MKHSLKISVSKVPRTDGIVSCKSIALHEKMLNRLLGEKRKVVVLIPGDSVNTVSISEVSEGGCVYE